MGNSGSNEPGDVVENDEIVNGYEYSKGQYAINNSSQLDNLRVPSKDPIAVSQFIDQNELNTSRNPNLRMMPRSRRSPWFGRSS